MNWHLNPASFAPKDFLARYWQQQPGLFRQAFKHFTDPVSPDELAGIALEPGVDSRVIWQNNAGWQLEHGPHEDYDRFGERDWSLLVQAVNEHHSLGQRLLRAFRFLPDWRVDDLMVSFSTPGGGVGPHLDQYDVFIIQGSGQRRWRVGPQGDYPTTCPHPELKQIADFPTLIEAVLEPGDMLYIPAGFPHEGESLTQCLNYSVGFRAPSQADLLSALADYALEHDQLQKRYQDPAESLNQVPWELPESAVRQCRQLLQQALHNEELLHRVSAQVFATNPRPPLPEWPQEPWEKAQLLAAPGHGLLQRAIGLRLITTHIGGQLYAVAQQHWFKLDATANALVELLNIEEEGLALTSVKPLLEHSPLAAELLVGLLNEGLLYLE